MTEKEELELRLATTLSPMLLTVAIFSLTATSAISNAPSSIVDELLSVLASFCIFSAALLIDSALDKLSLSFFDRLTFLGGGYLLFCIAVGAMTAIVPIFYEAKKLGLGSFGWQSTFIPFIAAGLFVLLKLMTFKDKSAFTVAIILSYFASAYVLMK